MHPEPLFELGWFKPTLYGICMAAGLISCFVFLWLAMRSRNFNEEAIDKILFIGFFGTAFGIFSAMLFQSTYNYIANPSAGFNLGGSMTFIGGLIGGVVSFLAVYWIYIYAVAPRAKSTLLQNNMNGTLTDALPLIPIGIVIAHAFGRLGCFFAGCCYGMPVDELGIDGVWGLPCSAPGRIHSDVLVIPTQLYECVFLVLLGVVMAVLYFKFKFNYNFALYAVAYGIWRFLIEFVRGDERGEFIGAAFSPSQIWSVVMIIAGIGYVFLQRFVLEKHMKHPELQEKVKKEEPQKAGTQN